MKDALEQLLEEIRAGQLSVDQAVARLRTVSTEDRQELGELSAVSGEEIDLGHSRLDADRARRSGLPEVVFAEGKATTDLLEIVDALIGRVGRVLATRVRPDQLAALRQRWPEGRWRSRSRLWSAGVPVDLRAESRVAVLSAGTSDAAVADEVSGVLEWSGVVTEQHRDVGVAGLHRLTRRLDAIRAADVVIVVAGMDGALPSVVAGLVPAPVIAVPTSVGYGAAFEGLAPLLTMLNACSPGIAVVNIDNGYGAAALAVKMLRVGSGGSSSMASP